MGATCELRARGLRELEAAITAADSGTHRALGTAARKAGDVVAKEARRRVPTRSGHAAASVRALDGFLTAGGARAPYFGWLDFGGRVGRSRSVSRPKVQGGRYVYRALSAEKTRMLAILDDELAQLAKTAGLDPR